jgi:hypothetical protein
MQGGQMNPCLHIQLRLQSGLKQVKAAIPRTAWLVLALVLWNGLGLHAAISKGERKALVAFYNAANGDNWGKNTGWKDGALEADGFGPVGSESKWYGITVSTPTNEPIYCTIAPCPECTLT